MQDRPICDLLHIAVAKAGWNLFFFSDRVREKITFFSGCSYREPRGIGTGLLHKWNPRGWSYPHLFCQNNLFYTKSNTSCFSWLPTVAPHYVSSGKQGPCFKAGGLLKHETVKESLGDIFKRLYEYFSDKELALFIIGNAENRAK